MNILKRVELLKDMVQTTIDQGASTVEEVHNAIADLPFDMLEKRGLLDDSDDTKKEARHQTVGAVYNKIREVNKIIGDLASDVFENIEDARHADKVMQEKGDSKEF